MCSRKHVASKATFQFYCCTRATYASLAETDFSNGEEDKFHKYHTEQVEQAQHHDAGGSDIINNKHTNGESSS